MAGMQGCSPGPFLAVRGKGSCLEPSRIDNRPGPVARLGARDEDVALEREWAVFERELPRLLAEGHKGKFVLIHGDALADIFATLEEAMAAGYDRFGIEPFLAQEIND